LSIILKYFNVVVSMNQKKVIDIVNQQNRWRRKECLNLIASESLMSPLAESLYTSDFEGRYNEHIGPECHYEGTELSYEIEEGCNQLFRDHFKTPYVDVRPISGAIANIIVYNALTRPGDILVSLGIPNGAHISHTRWGPAGIRGLKNVDMSFDAETMNINVEGTVDIIKASNPKLVMFGASMFLFPEPIREIREQVDPDLKFVYDAAHVMGLVYGGIFQDPFAEGVDIITSSTHKTFQGPQGGIIIGSPGLSKKDWKKIDLAVFPGTLSSTHIHRFPSLAITALEMNEYTVHTAYNGREGLDKALKFMPNIILLDVVMPLMDGFEMLETLRGDPDGREISVIMLTARNHAKDVERASMCGIEDFIVKPFEVGLLLEKIENIAENLKMSAV
jgi:glycine hydroxymethyltransferase